MESRHKRKLSDNLPKFVAQVDPQQLLPYLPCLSQHSQDEINAAQNSRGRSHAANVLHSHLIRKPKAFKQLIKALRHENVEQNELADLLDDSRDDRSTNGGLDDLGYRRHYNGSSSGVATGWQARQQSSYTSVRRRRTPPKCYLNTPWDKLPGGVQSILKKFDTPGSMKTIDDLADLLHFNIEDINRVKHEVQGGESLTLAFLTRWMQMEPEPATLGVIMKLFNDLGREDILKDLEDKTGVKFNRGEDGEVSPQPADFPQAGPLASIIYDRNQDNPNINRPSTKSSGNEKLVFKGESSRQRTVQKNINKEHKGFSHPVQQQENLNLRSESESHREIVSIEDNNSIKEIEKKNNNVGKFTGYRTEEILKTDSSYQRDNFQQNSREESQESNQTVRRELSSGELSQQVKEGSGGFTTQQTSQDHDDPIKVEKNDLDGSVSSCSDNSMYDSQPDNNFINDLDSGAEKSSERSPLNVGNLDDKSESEENKMSLTDTLETEEAERNAKEDRSFEKRDIEDRDSSNRFPEVNPIIESKTLSDQNRSKSFKSSEMVFDEDAVKSEFSKLVFEEKMRTSQNFSNITSQSDPLESRDSSVAMTDISVSDRDKTKRPKKSPFNSMQNYEDYSLEDRKRELPEETNYSGELNSIEKKAAKQLPGCFVPNKNADVDTNDMEEYPTGSFQFDFDKTLSTDGESTFEDNDAEQPASATKQQSDSDGMINGCEEMEFTRRVSQNDQLSESEDVPETDGAAVDKTENNSNVEEENTFGDGTILKTNYLKTLSKNLKVEKTSAQVEQTDLQLDLANSLVNNQRLEQVHNTAADLDNTVVVNQRQEMTTKAPGIQNEKEDADADDGFKGDLQMAENYLGNSNICQDSANKDLETNDDGVQSCQPEEEHEDSDRANFRNNFETSDGETSDGESQSGESQSGDSQCRDNQRQLSFNNSLKSVFTFVKCINDNML